MRKFVLVLLVLIPATSFAQRYPDRSVHRFRDTTDLSLWGGYRYGGTLTADQADLFNQDVDIASSASIGAAIDLPVSPSLKIELMVSNQSSHFTTGDGTLFGPGVNIANVDITYYQAGLMFPFDDTRDVHPYFVATAGIANISPKVPQVSSATRFGASGAVGARFQLTPAVGLRVEERGYFTSLPQTNECFACTNKNGFFQGETNIGVSFSF
jgi:Outer membrane protein beta-barrel domain